MTLQSLLPDQIIERIGVGIITVDTNFCVIQWNAFMVEHTGTPARDAVGRSLFECFTDLPEHWLKQKMRAVIRLKNYAYTSWQQRPYLFALAHDRTVTGGVDYMQQDVTFLPIKDPQNEVIAICITIYDRTETALLYQAAADANQKLTLALARVEQLSREDSLTGAFNRRVLDERLSEELARVQRYRAPATFILIDLDHFKLVNDKHGHLAGDQVLIHVARLVSSMVRDTDVFARYGGEEFSILLPGVAVSGGLTLAERVRQAVESYPLDYQGCSISLTLSVGITQLRPGHASIESVYAEADSALYSSKREGRNRVTCFAPLDGSV